MVVGRRMHPGANARNLKKSDLGAVIFGCTQSTMDECLKKQIFGLPALHISYVQNIQPGLPLFLFNYSNRKLYGIFEAASSGQLNIDPHAWTPDGSSKTPYPAQVRFSIRWQCRLLSEEKYKKIFGNNYYGQSRFRFELDHAQTGALLSSFELFSATTPHPYNAPGQSIHEALNDNICKDGLKVSTSDQKQDFSDDVTPHADAGPLDENSKASTFEANREHSGDGNAALDSSSTNSFQDEENEATQMLELQLNVEGPESEEERCLLELKQITLDRETSNICLENHIKEAIVPCTLSWEESSVEPSFREKSEDVPVNTNYQSVIDQLRRQLDDLKALSARQLVMTNALENKLASSDFELQQLRGRVQVLESQSTDPSALSVGEPSHPYYSVQVTEAFNGPQVSLKDLIFVMGGSDADGTRLSTMECYSTSRDILRSLKPMSAARLYSSAAVADGHVFTFGGCGDPNSNMWYDTVEYYSPWTNEWALGPPLSERKGCLASATLQNKIYAFGGGNGYDVSSKVEMFDPVLGRWVLTEPMLQKRFSAAAAELNGAFYVAGGYADGTYLKSAERFDPREVSWSRLPSMNTSRGSHSLAVLNEKLYTLGGFDGNIMVPSVEVFDPRIGSWVVDDEMKQSRGYFFAPVFGERIYAFGGRKEHGALSETVECYKEGCGWTVTKLKGLGKRSFFSAAIFN